LTAQWISFPSQLERAPRNGESWVQEWLEDRLVRGERGDRVREDSGQQDGKLRLYLPKNRDFRLSDGWVHDGGAAGTMR
jgi:predicted nucleic acid-binding Zn finger protein